MERAPYNAKAIASSFLTKRRLTQMELHKLVHYAHGWHLERAPHGRRQFVASYRAALLVGQSRHLVVAWDGSVVALFVVSQLQCNCG